MRSFILFFIVLFYSILTPGYTSEVVLISGASRGIGLSIADLLAREGYIVYAGVRATSSGSLLKVKERYPDHLHIISLDVTDENIIQEAVKTILTQEGKIDVLVNNAGIGIYGTVENVTIEEAQKVFDINFFGAMRLSQAVLPSMRAQNKGRIIQISSRSGFRPHVAFSLYAASKFALEGLSETMAATLKPWNIHVSLIEPGPVNTSFDVASPYGSRLPRSQDLYGSRLEQSQDPFYPMFEKVGFFDPSSPDMQEPEDIARIVKEAIEAKEPLFRYQTSEKIKKQAAERLVDITGLSSLNEWNRILFN